MNLVIFFKYQYYFKNQLLSDEIKLLKAQKSIDQNFKLTLSGKPLYETLGELIRLSLLDEAEKMRKEFKISDTSES